MPATPDDITLAILAGGAGSRMGRPKALLRVSDRPILEHLLERFAWPGPTMLVTAPGRERPPGAERFGSECVDPVTDQGPLRGILTALENAASTHAVIAAVDMPMLEHRHVLALVSEMRSRRELLGLMPARVVEEHRHTEPFPSIFHRGAIDAIRARLANDELSVARLVDHAPARFATVDVNWEPTAWLNLNHPTDLPLLAQYGLRIQ